jgi:poly-D-alanine transfer protein DltD
METRWQNSTAHTHERKREMHRATNNQRRYNKMRVGSLYSHPHVVEFIEMMQRCRKEQTNAKKEVQTTRTQKRRVKEYTHTHTHTCSEERRKR